MGSEKCQHISKFGKAESNSNRQAAQIESKYSCQIARKNNCIN